MTKCIYEPHPTDTDDRYRLAIMLGNYIGARLTTTMFLAEGMHGLLTNLRNEIESFDVVRKVDGPNSPSVFEFKCTDPNDYSCKIRVELNLNDTELTGSIEVVHTDEAVIEVKKTIAPPAQYLVTQTPFGDYPVLNRIVMRTLEALVVTEPYILKKSESGMPRMNLTADLTRIEYGQTLAKGLIHILPHLRNIQNDGCGASITLAEKNHRGMCFVYSGVFITGATMLGDNALEILLYFKSRDTSKHMEDVFDLTNSLRS